MHIVEMYLNYCSHETHYMEFLKCINVLKPTSLELWRDTNTYTSNNVTQFPNCCSYKIITNIKHVKRCLHYNIWNKISNIIFINNIQKHRRLGC